MESISILFPLQFNTTSDFFIQIESFSFIGLFFQIGGTSTVPPADEHPNMVTLLSYNVHNFGGNNFEAHPKDSCALAFLELLKEHQPQVLCLQEYSPYLSLTDSLELLGYNHFYGAHGSNTSPNGTVVFSKLPITFVKKIDGQKLLVEIMNGKHTFRLICVHMDSYAFDQDDRDDIEHLGHLQIDSTSRRTMSKAKETVIRHETEWNEQLRPLVNECSLPLIMAGTTSPLRGSIAKSPNTSTTPTATKVWDSAPLTMAASHASASIWCSIPRNSPP